MSTFIAAFYIPIYIFAYLIQPSSCCHPERSEGSRRSVSASVVRRFRPNAQGL